MPRQKTNLETLIVRTADMIVIHRGRVLLIKRKNWPYADTWALPGGKWEEGETLEQTARRELQEETGLADLALVEIATFDEPGRDPRPGRWISTVFLTFVPDDRELCATAGDDAKEAQWFELDQLPPLAFDHEQMIACVKATLEKPQPDPTVVCLCGSTRFFQAFDEANLRETLTGRIVLSIGCNTRSDEHLHLVGCQIDKEMLDWLHRRKIDLSDEILVLNVGGYVGPSTRSEIVYARIHNKRVRWLEGCHACGCMVETEQCLICDARCCPEHRCPLLSVP